MELESTRKRICATYAGDMHALELHMLQAFEKQLGITQDYHDAHQVVRCLVAASKHHAEVLHKLVSALGDVEKILTDRLKSAVAGLFGLAAGIVDTVRPLGPSKAFRDSYTAINHAIVGYVMLSTTAVALDNEETRMIADRFLKDWIELSRRVISLVPDLVLRDLRDEGIHLSDYEAAVKIRDNKEWSLLFRCESNLGDDLLLEKRGDNLHPNLSTGVPLPRKEIIVEKAVSSGTLTARIDPPHISKVTKPPIFEQTLRPERIVEVQPVIHREITAPEVHHVERHIYERIESGPAVITNKPIIEEVIKPEITEELQEIIHRQIPAPFFEKVEKLTDEFETMPVLHTKEVICEQERVVQADVFVKDDALSQTKLTETKLEETISTTPAQVKETEKLEVITEDIQKTTITTTPGVAAGGPPPKASARSHKKHHHQ